MSRSMETWFGLVRTPGDAIVIFEACRQNILPRVQRRLSEKERQAIRSGSVFVWDEKEAGMRRWTDGKSWSASRVAGSFLTYREMEGKRGSCERQASGSYKKRGASSESEEKEDPNTLDGYQYKSNGLVKQSFSITNSDGHHLHLISYYSRAHNSMRGSPLMTPSEDPRLRQVKIQKGMYPESTMADIAAVHSTSVSPAMAKAQAQQEQAYEHSEQMGGPYGYQAQRPISRSPYQPQSYDARPNVTVNTDLTSWRSSATPASAYHTATSDIRPEMVDRTPSSSSAVRNDNSLAPYMLTRPSPEPNSTLQLPSLTNRDPSPQAHARPQAHSRQPSNSEYPYQQSHSNTSTPVIRHTSPFTLPPLQPGFQNQSPHQRQQSTPPRLTPEYSTGSAPTPPSLPGIASLLNTHPSPSSATTYLAPSSATSVRLPSLPPTSMASIDPAQQQQFPALSRQVSGQKQRNVGLGVDMREKERERSRSLTPGGAR